MSTSSVRSNTSSIMSETDVLKKEVNPRNPGSPSKSITATATATATSTSTSTSTPTPPPTPPPTNTSTSSKTKHRKNPLLHLVAGGTAGFVETSICHPLDTIKTRMQLRRTQAAVAVVRKLSSMAEPNATAEAVSAAATAASKSSLSERNPIPSFTPAKKPGTVSAPLGPMGTAVRIVQREGFNSLYKGLTAVYTGIVPKMAIRFVSFEAYRDYLQNCSWFLGPVTLVAGLMSGLTEAVLVVTPAEVCKIRMQSQFHSMMDPSQMARRKYRNVFQTAMTITKEEGPSALYKGVVPTMIRQGINQGVNFSCYQLGKSWWTNHNGGRELESWKTMVIGGLSGGVGPLVNNPLDVVKTRMQRQVITPDSIPKYTGILQSCVLIAKEEGWPSLWKGLTPRLMRIMPGQAVTFTVYEGVSSQLVDRGFFQ